MPRYRVLVGGHQDKNGDYHARHPDPKRRYVTTDKDLVKMFGANKFRKVDDAEDEEEAEADADKEAPVVGSVTGSELEAMSAKELKKFAEELEIDVEGLSKKEDLIRAIKTSEAGAM